jgi:hypothetical protein
MAVVHIRFECQECPFVSTDEVEAEMHADAERHCVEVSGEIQPRVGLGPQQILPPSSARRRDQSKSARDSRAATSPKEG